MDGLRSGSPKVVAQMETDEAVGLRKRSGRARVFTGHKWWGAWRDVCVWQFGALCLVSVVGRGFPAVWFIAGCAYALQRDVAGRMAGRACTHRPRLCPRDEPGRRLRPHRLKLETWRGPSPLFPCEGKSLPCQLPEAAGGAQQFAFVCMCVGWWVGGWGGEPATCVRMRDVRLHCAPVWSATVRLVHIHTAVLNAC